MSEPLDLPERESMEFDVVIVGAGPAGLSAAIRLKQVNPDLSVVVLEKGSEVGAHILSGAVVDPIGIDALLPGWREDDSHPFKTEVTDDHFLFLGPAGSIRLPNFAMPPLMNNHGNYIVSLGNVCRWLATKAEELGVEIYPGFAAAEVLYNDKGAVIGVATGDMGIERNGEPGPNFTRGMELLGKYTLISEGVRGSLAKQLISKFKLDEGREPQKFGIGIKELWQVKPEKHRQGLVQHSFGWPLDMKTGGGSFLYHLEDNLVAVGFVLLIGCAVIALSGIQLWQFWTTLILLGLGWNFGFIGATAMVTESYRPEEKGTIQGFHDLILFGSVAFASLMSGAVYNAWGWSMLAWIVFPVSILCLVALGALRSTALRQA